MMTMLLYFRDNADEDSILRLRFSSLHKQVCMSSVFGMCTVHWMNLTMYLIGMTVLITASGW